MTTWAELAVGEREAANLRAFGWLSAAVGADRLREESWKADAFGSREIALALLRMADMIERAS